MSFICDGCFHYYGSGNSPVRTVTKIRPVVYHIQLVGKRGNERNIMSRGEEVVEEKDFCEGCAEDFDKPVEVNRIKEVDDETQVNRKIGV